jgi:subtilisin family serine protease
MSEGNEGLLNQPGVIEVASAGKQSAVGSALYAPGREILTLLPGGHYDFASGDSMATAEISGVVALLLAKKSGLSAEDAYRLLRDTSAHPVGDAGGGVFVDACAAMVSLVGHGYCNPTTDNGPRMADELEQRVARH